MNLASGLGLLPTKKAITDDGRTIFVAHLDNKILSKEKIYKRITIDGIEYITKKNFFKNGIYSAILTEACNENELKYSRHEFYKKS